MMGGREGAGARRRQRKAARPASGLRAWRGGGGMDRMISRLWKTVRTMIAGGLVFGGVATTRLFADLAADLARISVEAAGGIEAHAALKSFRATGVTKVGDKEIGFTLYAARPRSVRIETAGEKGSLVRSFDGVRAPWKLDALGQAPRRLGRAEELDFILDADFDNPLHDHEARKISLDHGGTVEVEGRACHKLLATVRFTEVVTLYIDAETLLLVRRDVRQNVRRSAVLETYYSDFTEVGGVRLPRRIRTQVDGHVLYETMIREYRANPPLPADFFAPPAKDWPGF
jgi:hypothetical protein